MPLTNVVSLPPLSLQQAHALAGFFAALYVGSLYVSQHTRISYSALSGTNVNQGRVRHRDDPSVIRARLLAVSASSIVSCVTLFCVVYSIVAPVPDRFTIAFERTKAYLGMSGTIGLRPSLIAPVLFLGPLYVLFLSGTLPLQRNWSFKGNLYPLFFGLIGFRNHVVAPITEEVVFRACILAVYHLAGCSQKRMIFLSPLWFGLAHVHHGWEVYHRLGRTSTALKNAILSVVVQTAYTTLFGFHCSYLFLRTGSIIPPIASHVFCNIMGLPGFTSDLAEFPSKRYGIIIAYLLGVYGYIYTLRMWTRNLDSVFYPDFRIL